MKLQRTKYTCGPLAIVNAARVLGVKIPERRVRAHTGTTREHGTTEHGIKNALERVGLAHEDLHVESQHAFEVLHEVVKETPVILSVEDHRHWVVAIGVSGPRILTFDSWDSLKNRAECGVDVWDKRGLTRWWASSNAECYGIVVRCGS
jgi:ABC-type bacteriocin/lantibiotic exporter with double-glycine peptidase domain